MARAPRRTAAETAGSRRPDPPTARDTERPPLDAEARWRASRFEALEQLAGGVAHDFNNLLLGMIGQAELALMELPAEHPARDAVAEIVKVGFRAADVCKQLLAYCGRGEYRVEAVELPPVLRGLQPLLQANLRGLEFALDLAADLPPLAIDGAGLQQVLLNLVQNAAEASRDGAGAIELRAAAHDRAAGELRDHVTGRELPAGRYVRLEVRDRGAGIAPELLPRIFDPFFTTKPARRGLGLAAVLGVVRGHHGAVSVTSAEGRGTTVTIDLPAAPSPAPRGPSPGGAADPSPADARPARVLIVDDEESVRRVASRLLESAGHQVTSSADAYVALQLFGAEPDAFDLVLLDMTMPGLSGVEALARVREFRPQVPVLLSSGFQESEVTALLAADPACDFIQKPYAATELRRRIDAMLRGRR